MDCPKRKGERKRKRERGGGFVKLMLFSLGGPFLPPPSTPLSISLRPAELSFFVKQVLLAQIPDADQAGHFEERTRMNCLSSASSVRSPSFSSKVYF